MGPAAAGARRPCRLRMRPTGSARPRSRHLRLLPPRQGASACLAQVTRIHMSTHTRTDASIRWPLSCQLFLFRGFRIPRARTRARTLAGSWRLAVPEFLSVAFVRRAHTQHENVSVGLQTRLGTCARTNGPIAPTLPSYPPSHALTLPTDARDGQWRQCLVAAACGRGLYYWNVTREATAPPPPPPSPPPTGAYPSERRPAAGGDPTSGRAGSTDRLPETVGGGGPDEAAAGGGVVVEAAMPFKVGRDAG